MQPLVIPTMIIFLTIGVALIVLTFISIRKLIKEINLINRIIDLPFDVLIQTIQNLKYCTETVVGYNYPYLKKWLIEECGLNKYRKIKRELPSCVAKIFDEIYNKIDSFDHHNPEISYRFQICQDISRHNDKYREADDFSKFKEVINKNIDTLESVNQLIYQSQFQLERIKRKERGNVFTRLLTLWVAYGFCFTVSLSCLIN